MINLAIMLFLTGCTASSQKQSDTHAAVAIQQVEQCANIIGGKACNFSAVDADENDVELTDLMGSPFILDLSAMWCGPCQEAAWNSNSVDVSSGGVKWITVLIENLDGEAPSVEDGQMWGDYFGIWHNEILLGSPDNRDPEGFNGFANTGWPYFLILDKDLMIRVVQHGWNKEEILQHIADLKSE